MRKNAGSQKHKTLQHRFLIFTLLISLLLIVLTLGFSFAYFLRSMSATTEEYLTSYIRYADDALTERLNNATLLAHTAASDERIIQQAIRNSAPEASYPWFLEQMSVRSYLNGLIVDKSYISRIALVLHNRTIFSSGDTLYWHSIHESCACHGSDLRFPAPERAALLVVRRYVAVLYAERGEVPHPVRMVALPVPDMVYAEGSFRILA